MLVSIVCDCQGAGCEELRASIVIQVFSTITHRVLSSDNSAILSVRIYEFVVQCTFVYHLSSKSYCPQNVAAYFSQLIPIIAPSKDMLVVQSNMTKDACIPGLLGVC